MSWFRRGMIAIDPALEPESGLQAVPASDRAGLTFEDPRRIEGSVHIDERLRPSRPNEPRWDYAIAYSGGTWFVEVHPATSGANLDEVLAKARWLRTLIANSEIRNVSRGFYWIASGAVSSHPAFSRRRRELAQAGVIGPRSRLLIA